MKENWLPVVGFEGQYEVSDCGRVRSVARQIGYGETAIQVRTGKVLKPFPVGKGHLAISLGRGNRRKVHLLVLEAFVGPRPEGELGLHNNGDVNNNQLSNLRWDTYSANQFDAVDHGTHPWASRTKCNYGHPLDGVIHKPDGSFKQRYCKTCHRGDSRRRKRQLKVLNPPPCQTPGCKNVKTPGRANQYCEECRAKAKERRRQRARQRAHDYYHSHKT
jgi:hypothetical protein